MKIVRQPNKIALIGAPSSAAAFLPGSEKAPAALRAAGIAEKLRNAGYEVVDHGDCEPRHFATDDEHRRARNLTEIVAGLNDLKARCEIAVKSGALVLVLGGDCAQSMGLIAGVRRYYKHIDLVWMDRDADLNTPASTPSGRIDGMVVAHIMGKGAPELVRFWREQPMVREPDILLFGIERLDPGEQEYLSRSPIRHADAMDIQAKGAAKAAMDALGLLHADARDFVLHLDADVIAQEDFPPVNVPGSGGLRFEEAREAFTEFVRQKNLLGLDVAQYNPDRDPGGEGAAKLVDLIVGALAARRQALMSPPEAAAPGPEEASPATPEAPQETSSPASTGDSPQSSGPETGVTEPVS